MTWLKRLLIVLILVPMLFSQSLLAKEDESGQKADVLFDEAHNGWWTFESDKAYLIDPGSSNFHNYWDLKEHLEAQKFHIVTNNQELSQDILQQYDILIIQNPSDWAGKVSLSLYKEEEIQAIIDFVNDGGALFVITHPGQPEIIYENLNAILSGFGINIVNNLVNDPVNANEDSSKIFINSFEMKSYLHASLGCSVLTKNIYQLYLADSLSFELQQSAISIGFTSSLAWASAPPVWEKQHTYDIPLAPVIAASRSDQGKVVAIGSGNLAQIWERDNLRFIDNILLWFSENKDWDGDGLSNKSEYMQNSNILEKDTDHDGWIDAKDPWVTNKIMPNLLYAIVSFIIITLLCQLIINLCRKKRMK